MWRRRFVALRATGQVAAPKRTSWPTPSSRVFSPCIAPRPTGIEEMPTIARPNFSFILLPPISEGVPAIMASIVAIRFASAPVPCRVASDNRFLPLISDGEYPWK
ncbi:hypothetical protein GCM10017559_46580 [Streptosporangium longisporum]|uniref:Uncharacterized protein n=1 Tax=Streptosporangium longisporum TaxID=46187 RepID=A0ABN3Y3T9_9ACTN